MLLAKPTRKDKSMCPGAGCKRDNPVQLLIDPHVAQQIGHPDLGNAVRCNGCGTLGFIEEGNERIVSRLTGQDLVSAICTPVKS
jgi:hypothetical protein